MATVQPKASKKSRRPGELRRQLVGHRRLALGVVGGVELGPVGGGVGPEAEDDGARPVDLDLSRIRLAVPSSALTGFPSRPDDRARQRVEGAEQHRGRVDGEQGRGHRRLIAGLTGRARPLNRLLGRERQSPAHHRPRQALPDRGGGAAGRLARRSSRASSSACSAPTAPASRP